MRHYPSCWNRTLAKLGFRRLLRRRAKSIPGRLSRIESLEVRQLLAADVSITQFNVDADPTKLHVAYLVGDGPADDDYAISIYRSLDGATPYLDAIHSEPIDKDDATGDFTFEVHFGADTLEDYYLIAVAEDADSSPSNNTRVFEGGAFQDTSGTVQYHGAMGTISDYVQVTSSGGMYKLQRWQGGSYVTLFEQANLFDLHARTHGGDDYVAAFNLDLQSWIFTGAGNDTVYAGTGDDYLDGGNGNDWLYGNGGDDQLRGGGDNDVGYGGDGNDVIYGGSEADWLSGEAGDDSIYAGAGDDTAYGGDGADLLHGDAGNDIGYGGSGNDVYLYTAADQGSYADAIVEDSAVDTDKLDFSAFAPAVFIDLGVTTQQSVTSTLRLTLSSATGIEDVVGTSLADVLIGNSRDNVLEGGDGSDYFEGHGGADLIRAGVGDDAGYGGAGSDEFWGGDGSDRFWGEADDDLIYGEAGDDGGYGGDGSDGIHGGDGNDELTGDIGADLIHGDAGDDAIAGGDGDDVAYGGDGNDVLQGETGNDWLAGELGDDLVKGGGGGDQLIGGDGSDIYQYQGGDADNSLDEIIESDDAEFDVDSLEFIYFGNSVTVDLGLSGSQIVHAASNLRLSLSSSNAIENLYGSVFADTLTGNLRNNVIYGFNGNDVIHGGDGADLLFGGNNDDDLYGDAGGDILYGEAGNDDLYGGTQNDILIQAAGTGTLEWKAGQGTTPDKIIVTTMVDENETLATIGFGIEDLSLREALVVAANQAGTDAIEFDESASGILELAGTQLSVNSNVSIKGHGAQSTIIDAKGLSRVFSISAGVTATLEDLKLTGGGNVSEGGGVLNAGDLTLQSVVIAGNTTIAAGHGGGVQSVNWVPGGASWLRIIDSTIDGNRATGGSGVSASVNNGGVLEVIGSTISNNVGLGLETSTYSAGGGLSIAGNATGTVTIANSTISGNSALYSGGVRLQNNNAPTTIVNSTIAYNTGNESGGLQRLNNTVAPVLHNTIVAENKNHAGARIDVAGALDVSSSYNIFGAGAGSATLTGVGNQIGTSGTPIDPKLGPLADNGGATKTHALIAGSPAFDAGSGTIATAAGVTTDQRGEVRNDGAVDIGAYETELVVSTLTDESDGDYSVGDLSLREALLLAGLNSASNEITFDSSLAGTIVLNPTLGQLAVTSSVKLVGPGADQLAIDANEASRALLVSGTGTLVVEISGLTIAGGKIEGDGAGIYNNSENLTLTRVTVTDNHAWGAQGLGGGLFSVGGQLTIHESTFHDNDATRGGAVRTQYGTTLTITASTFYENEASAIEGALSTHQTTASITNSTFSGNSAPNGGAIRTNSTGQMTIINSTIVNNTATTGYGGGIQVTGAGTVTLHNTILAANTAGAASASNDVNGALDAASSYNIIGSGANGQTFTGLGNQLGEFDEQIDPKLAPLADYNGPTKTHATLVGSPALNAGDDTFATEHDQRGHDRIFYQTDAIDIGAYEAGNPTSYRVTTLDDELDAGELAGSSDLSLREAIALASQNAEMEIIYFAKELFVAGPSRIVIDPSLGAFILKNDNSLYIIGPGEAIFDVPVQVPGATANWLTIDAVGQTGNVFAGNPTWEGIAGGNFVSALEISGMTLTGAYSAAIDVSEAGTDVVIKRSELVGNNTAIFHQPVVYGTHTPSLYIEDSTIANNESSGVRVAGGSFTAKNVTVSGNAGVGMDIGALAGLYNVTVVDNGIGVKRTNNAAVYLRNSIFVGNDEYDLQGNFAGSNNIIGSLQGYVPTGNGNQFGKTKSDVKLGELGQNGGATRTRALLPGSIAINPTADGYATAADQRGVARSTPDIGAFELESPQSISGDFDNDGTNDVVYIDWTIDNVNVLLNRGGVQQLSSWAKVPAGVVWSGFQVGDFNGDGRDDLIARNGNNWTLLLSESNRFVVHEDVMVNQNWSHVLIGDFDGDGSDEMIGWDSEREVIGSAEFSWEMFHYSQQTGAKIDEGFNAWGRFPGYLNGFELAGIWVADVNQDGRDDLVSKVTKTPPGDSAGWWVGLSTSGGHINSSHVNATLFSGPNHFDVRYWGNYFDSYYNASPSTFDPEKPYRDLVAAFAKVYNNVDLDFYYGIKKGPTVTLETGSANPFDQAIAMIEELKNTPFAPRLITGRVKITAAEAKEWLGLKPEAASGDVSSLLQKLSNPNVAVTYDGEHFTFDHAWVQVQVPALSPADDNDTAGDGWKWINLDPSWKFKSRQEGVSLAGETDLNPRDAFGDGFFDEYKFLSETVVEKEVGSSSTLPFQILGTSPLEFVENELQTWLADNRPGKSIADIFYDGPVKNPVTTSLPTKAAYLDRDMQSLAARGDYTAIKNDATLRKDLMHRFRLSVLEHPSSSTGADPTFLFSYGWLQGADGTALLSEMPWFSSIVVSPTNVTLHTDKNHVVYDANSPASVPFKDLRLYFQEYAPGVTAPGGATPHVTHLQSNSIRVPLTEDGETIGLGINFGQYSAASVEKAEKDVLVDGHNDIRGLVQLAVNKYGQKYNHSIDVIAALSSSVPVRKTEPFFIRSNNDVLPITDTFSPYGRIPKLISFWASVEPAPPAEFYAIGSTPILSEVTQLAKWQQSTLESQVFEELFVVNGVSAVRLLQRQYGGQVIRKAQFVNDSNPALGLTPTDPPIPYAVETLELTVDSSGYPVLYSRGFSKAAFNGATDHFDDPLRIYNQNLGDDYAIWVSTLKLSEINDSAELSLIQTQLAAVLNNYLRDRGQPVARAGIAPEVGHYFGTSIELSGSQAVVKATKTIVQPGALAIGGWSGTSFLGQKLDSATNYQLVDYFDTDEQFTQLIIRGSISTGEGVPEYPSFIYVPKAPQQSLSGFPPEQLTGFNGNLSLQEHDITYANIGVALDFNRTYNSLSTRNVGFGAGWSHSFSDRLVSGDNSNEIVWLTSTGAEHRFTLDANSLWQTPSELTGKLIVTADEYVFLASDGSEIHWAHKDETNTALNDPSRPEANRANGSAEKPWARLTKKVDSNGNGVGVAYVAGAAAAGRIAQIDYVYDLQDVNQYRRLDFSYDASFTISSIETLHLVAAPYTWSYEYQDVSGAGRRLTKVHQPEGPADDYVYRYVGQDAGEGTSPSIGMLKQRTNANSEIEKFRYYANDRLYRRTRVVSGQEQHTTYSYDLVHGRTTITDPLGNVETLHFNRRGLVTEEINADRTHVSTRWGVPDTATPNPIDVIVGTEFLKYRVVDEVGATASFEYYVNPVEAGYKQLKESITKEFIDETNGNTLLDGNRGVKTQYLYQHPSVGGKDHVILIKETKVIDPALGNPITTLSYEPNGKLSSIKDPANNYTSFTYYANGLLKSTIKPKGQFQPGEGTSPTNEAVNWRILTDNYYGFTITGDTITVRLLVNNSTGSGAVVADAIRIDRIDDDGVATTVIDDAASAIGGFSTTGTWSSVAGDGNKYFGDARSISPVNGQTFTADWTFTGLEPGNYRISATWPESASNNPSATYQIFKGTGSGSPFHTTIIDQTTPPGTGDEYAWFKSYETIYEYDEAGNLLSAKNEKFTSSYAEYHPYVRLPAGITETDDWAGRGTTYWYDDLGRLEMTRQEEAGGWGALTTTIAYDNVGRPKTITDPLGRISQFAYNERGNVLQETGADGAILRHSYDKAGNRILTVDPLGRETRFVYDSRHRLIQTLHADGAVEQARYDGAGRIAATIDGRGNLSTFEYDAGGRLRKSNAAVGAGAQVEATVVNKYDNAGRLIEAIDAQGVITQYVYDNLGRVIQTRILSKAQDAAAARASLLLTTPTIKPVFLATTTYDEHGNVAEQIVYDVSFLTTQADDSTEVTTLLSNPKAFFTSLADRYQRTLNTYDSFNRLVRVTEVGAGVTPGADVAARSAYDVAGRLRHTYDEAGRETEMVYDAYGRLWKTIAPDPTGPNQPIVLQFAYDAAGNLVKETDALGHVTTHRYDSGNRLISSTDATGATTATQYNLAGEVIAVVDAIGGVSYSKRDSRGRVVQQRLSDPDGGDLDGNGTLAAPVTKYEYDAAGNVSRMIDSRGYQTRYAYDKRNRLTEEETLSASVIYGDDVDATTGATTFGFTATASNKNRPAAQQASGFGGDFVDLQTPGGVATANWRFDDLEDGTYRLALTWVADSSLDPNATVEYSLNGGASYTTVGGPGATFDMRRSSTLHDNVVNQVWDARNDDGEWQNWRLPAYTTIPNITAGADMIVRLRSSTGGIIRADGVMLEKTSAKTLFEYDDNNNLTKSTDAITRITNYEYDELNRLSKTTLPDSDGSTPALSSPTTAYQYDGYGNLVKQTESFVGASPSSPVRTDEWTYDRRNRVTQERLGSDEVATELLTNYVYDDVGDLRSMKEAVDGTFIETRYDYDELHRLLEERVLRTAGDAQSWMSKTAYEYDEAGNVIYRTDYTKGAASANVAETWTEYVYDAVNRLRSETRAAGLAQEAVTLYAYDAVGNLIYSVDPTGIETRNYYDALSRLTTTILPQAVSSVSASTRQQRYRYDSAGNLVASTNGDNETTQFEYDAQGRQIRVIDPNGSETRYRYDDVGNLKQLIDPRANVTSFGYDKLDRLKTETNALGLSRNYTYDNDGNLYQAVDRNLRTTTYDYDNLGRLEVEEWRTSGGTLTGKAAYDYDQLGRLETSSQYSGTSSVLVYAETFDYDNLSRVTAGRNYDPANATSSIPKVETLFGYDVVPTNGAATVKTVRHQRFAASTNNAATTTYEYDALGRLATIADNRVVNFPVQPLSDIDEKTIAFAYDKAGRLTGVQRNVTATSFQFNTSYALDAAGRLQQIDHKLTASSTLFSHYQYAYDAADRIRQVDATTKKGSLDLERHESYGYDKVGQLTGVTPTLYDRSPGANDLSSSVPAQAYEYDNAGNRKVENSVAHTLDVETNRVESDDVYSYTYDDEGNLLTKTTLQGSSPNKTPTGPQTTYVWDNRNRLIEVVDAVSPAVGATVTERIKYLYNNDDLRVRKEVVVGAASTEHYVYEGDQLSLVLDGASKVKNRLLYAPGTDALLVDEVFSAGVQVESRWTATDHAGTVRDVIDGDDHAILEHREYEPFGELTEVVTGSKVDVSPSALATDFAFAGREWDNEADLYYNRARWLDEDLGRFISEDPIGYAGGDANLHRYSHNDPINSRDPSGLIEESFDDLVGPSAWYFPGLSDEELFGRRDQLTVYVDTGYSLADVSNPDPFSQASTANRYLAEQAEKQLVTEIDALNQEIGRRRMQHEINGLGQDSMGPDNRTVSEIVTQRAMAFEARALQARINIIWGQGTTEDLNIHLQYESTRAANSYDYFVAALDLITAFAATKAKSGSVLHGRAPSPQPLASQQGQSPRLVQHTKKSPIASGANPQPSSSTPSKQAHAPQQSASPKIVHHTKKLPTANANAQPNSNAPSRNAYNINTDGLSAAERNAIIEYARRTNAILAQTGPVVVQPTKGTLRQQASAAARQERLRASRAGQPYQGQAGHVPDTALTGSPNPPGGWLDMPGTTNNKAGGGLGHRIGTAVDQITVDGQVP